MNQFNRRDFVFLSSGAALGNMAVSGIASAAEHGDAHELDFSHSGLVTGIPKPLKHKFITGFLSTEQIAPHHTAHYGGALKGYSAADAKVEESVKAGQPLDPAAYDALKRAVNSKGNSVFLHEMYFDGLAPKATDPAADVRVAIEHRFGSITTTYIFRWHSPSRNVYHVNGKTALYRRLERVICPMLRAAFTYEKCLQFGADRLLSREENTRPTNGVIS